jgi:hypothetical protein
MQQLRDALGVMCSCRHLGLRHDAGGCGYRALPYLCECRVPVVDVLAEAVMPVIEDRLKFAASEIERELICCYGETCDDMQHEICRWGMAGRLIVLEVASGERFGDV